jgi:predicted RNA binding protein YcfA (HicA-like mRNA interferase family)
MRSFSSNEILKILKEDGWMISEQTGSHSQLRHSTKKGKVTVPHPKKDLPVRTIQSIFKQAGLK